MTSTVQMHQHAFYAQKVTTPVQMWKTRIWARWGWQRGDGREVREYFKQPIIGHRRITMPYVKRALPPYSPIPEALLAKISALAKSEARQIPMPEFYGYAVTRDGQIWSVRRANSRDYGKPKRRKLATYPKGGGYLTVALQDDKAQAHTVSVSRLVALTFIGEPPHEEAIVLHLDGDVTNNNASNLAWSDWQGYGENKMRNPNMQARGQDVNLAKLTDSDVADIRRRLKRESDEAIAEAYGVGRGAIQGIRTGKTWRHVAGKPTRQHRFSYGGSRSHFSKLTENDVREIRRIASSLSVEQLADRFSVSVYTISDILRGKTWKHVK